MKILCIDPGTDVSGAVLYDRDSEKLLRIFPAEPNESLLLYIEDERWDIDIMLFEMVASYGMPVGREVFETVRWAGNFEHAFGRERVTAVYRREVKLALCGSPRAKDGNVRQAVIDRFPAAGGGKIPAIGTKAKPGTLYGLTKHSVSALAVGLAWLDMQA